MIKRRNIPIWAVILVVVTTILLFVFSGQSGTQSNALSTGVMSQIISILRMELSSAQIILFHKFVRKSAHFGLFFLLGFGLAALFRRFGLVRCTLFTTLLSAVVAAANEYHQLLVGTRTASISDVLLDTAGAVAGCLLYCILYQIVQFFRRSREMRRR